MRKIPRLLIAIAILLAAMVLAYNCTNNGNTSVATDAPLQPSAAFQNHRDSVPSQQQYSGPLFTLSHNYPTTAKQVYNPSWIQALQGKPISDANVFAYMDSLKSYIEPNIIPFFTNNQQWNAAKYGWFHEPWLGIEREAVMGTYLGNGNPANMFKTLKEDESGYVLVLYDSTAAYTVGQIWGATGDSVNLANNATQFTEGSVIVKLAFSNINYPQWPVMQGAQTFQVYDTIATSASPAKGYQMRTVSFFQMDVIVKDSKTAPKTGWVYSTFVYDKDAPGSAWDKMVPLGAMWGNDPDVISPIAPPYPKLYETIINPKAPAYSTETLGWGGRLSGPNDGAVAQEVKDDSTGQVYKNLPLSSCMSCHLPAQDKFVSFLLPGPNGAKVYTPGSAKWNLWFRDNSGDTPFDSGQVAMDYDMVMAFKAVGNWQKAHPTTENKMLRSKVDEIQQFRRHNTRSRFWH